MATVLAFDPGGTTGICRYDTCDEQMDLAQIGPDPHHQELWDYLCLMAPDTIIFEQFFYQRRPVEKGISLSLISKEYIGVIMLYTTMNNSIVFPQSPSMMEFWSDDKIRSIGLWQPGMVHAMDALRHFLYWETFTMKHDKWVMRLREPE